jgi:5-hydroxyisourate hydrolase
MKGISTHVLDTAAGRPAADVPVKLERQTSSGDWIALGSAHTDSDGRCGQLPPRDEELKPGIYRLTFDSAAYFAAQGLRGLYPLVQITFAVTDSDAHLHIPLLLSPHGYTTYRGS